MDCYKLLSLPPDAPASQVHAQYRQLALLQHPGREHAEPHAAHQLFRGLGEAYDILKDALLRQAYDQLGYVGLTSRFHSLPVHPHGYRYHDDPLRTFEEHFGTSHPYADAYEPFDSAHDYHHYDAIFRPRAKAQLPPLIIGLEVTLEELFHGNIREVEFSRHVLLAGGDLAEQTVIKDIRIRPGTSDGTQFLFPGAGHQARGSQPADAVIRLLQLPHERFLRTGDDLRMVIEVDLLVALCGGDISLTGVDETPVRIEEIGVIRPGSGRTIPGLGMPRAEDPARRGDLHLDYRVVFPKDLDLVRREMIANALRERPDKAPVPTTLIGVSGYVRTPTLMPARSKKPSTPNPPDPPEGHAEERNYSFITEDVNVSQESLVYAT